MGFCEIAAASESLSSMKEKRTGSSIAAKDEQAVSSQMFHCFILDNKYLAFGSASHLKPESTHSQTHISIYVSIPDPS
jgi:hypothetical protein